MIPSILLSAVLCLSASPSSPPSSFASLTQEQVVTLTLLGEARGEGNRGMLAVANVIAKRAKAKHKTAKAICLAPKQFSFWNEKRSDYSRILGCKESAYASRLAHALVNGDFLPDVTGGATHYHATYCKPTWADAKRITAKINHHIFYRL